MARYKLPSKDPSDILDYSFDWTKFLDDDVIATAAFAIYVDDVIDTTLTSQGALVAEGTVTTWLTGGLAGTNYSLACTVTTTGGRTAQRSAAIAVRQL